MKKGCAFIFSFASMALLVTGCTPSILPSSSAQSSVHNHDFGDEWSHDDMYHWKQCKDPSCGEIDKKTPHDFYEDMRNQVEATCDHDGGYDLYKICSTCKYEKFVEHFTMTKLEHEYGPANYTWSEDNSTCTAKAVCNLNQSHVIEETVNTTCEVVSRQSCTVDGFTVYRASFTNPYFNEQRKEVTAPASGHDFGEATYSWSVDCLTCYAHRTCQKEGCGFIEYVSTTAVIDVIKEATETEDGLNKYTATFANKAYEQQVIERETGAYHSRDLFDVSYGSDGCSLTRKSTDISGEVVVPSKYGVVPVTSVDLSGCDKVTSVVLPNTLERIEMEDFRDCSSLKSLIIPQSVRSIGYRAFAGCDFDSITIYDTLRNVDSSAFLYADVINIKITSMSNFLGDFSEVRKSLFADEYHLLDENNNEITDIVIPNDVLEIKKSAFGGLKAIKSVDIGNGVKTIGENAFVNCNALATLKIGNALEEIDPTAFDGCNYFSSFKVSEDNPYYQAVDGILYNKTLTKIVRVPRWGLSGYLLIPASVDTIGDYAFYSCTGLTQILSNDYNSLAIGDHAFENCNNFSGIHIPTLNGNGLTAIGDYAFKGCVSLDYIYNISSSVTKIGRLAFNGCSSLASFAISSNISSIGEDAFSGCSSLASIDVDANNEYFSSINGVLFNKNQEELIKCPVAYDGDFVAPSTLKRIAADAFYGCQSLGSIALNEGLRFIGEYAFAFSSISSVNIPNEIETIETSAFHNCNQLSFYTYDNAQYLGNDSNNYVALIKSLNRQITSCKVHDDTKLIIDKAFSFSSYDCCRALETITLPNGLRSIGKEAFSYCSSLTALALPDSVTNIGERCFWGCSSLETVTLGNGLLTIEDGVFCQCAFASIVIPSSVTSIGKEAFESCDSLQSLTIGKNVKTIDKQAFYSCDLLTTINFDGTKEECEAINFAEWWNINVPARVIHCTNGDYAIPTIE